MRSLQLTMMKMMLMRYVVLVMLVIASVSARAQVQDSLEQNEDSLWVDEIPSTEGFSLGNDFVQHHSTGWFPRVSFSRSYGLYQRFYAGWWNEAYGIRSAGFLPTSSDFSRVDPRQDEELDFKQPNSDDDVDADSIDVGYNDYSAISLYLDYSLPIGVVVRGILGYEYSSFDLYSLDTSRAFLALNGRPQPFREVSIASINNYSVFASGSVLLPVYGAVVMIDSVSIASYYYAGAGASIRYNFIREFNQYVQIADAKDRIRYGNGRDYQKLAVDAPLTTAVTYQTWIDFYLGWKLQGDIGFSGGGALSFELFASLPQNSILTDASIKQYRFGLAFSMGFAQGL